MKHSINQLNFYSAPYKTWMVALNNVDINVNRLPNSNKNMLEMNNIKHITSMKHRARKCPRVSLKLIRHCLQTVMDESANETPRLLSDI